MLSEHDFKCIWAARNRPMAVAKMIGAVYRSWYSNVDALKKQFGKKQGEDFTDDERAIVAANATAAAPSDRPARGASRRLVVRDGCVEGAGAAVEADALCCCCCPLSTVRIVTLPPRVSWWKSRAALTHRR